MHEKTLPKPLNSFVQTPKLNSHTDAKQIFALNLKAQGWDHLIWLPDQCEGFHIQKTPIVRVLQMVWLD